MASSNGPLYQHQQQQRQQQYLANKAPKTVHILGTGSVGRLLAHSLRNLPDPPPVTLLLYRPRLIKEFNDANQSIHLTTRGVTESSSGYDFELFLPHRRDLGDPFYTPDTPRIEAEYEEFISNSTISNLIVCVKGPQTLSALEAVSHRLNADSTICFMQNGMGIVDEINQVLFPDVEVRPNYMLGINTHGVFSKGPFAAEHAGQGSISLGILPRDAWPELNKPPSPDEVLQDSSRYLLRTLTRSPVLAAVGLAPSELFQAQLEKLAVNCVINPVTVMIDSYNGDILRNFALTRTTRLLLSEVCLVIQNLPELQGVPNVASRFSVERMEAMVVTIAEKTARNLSSMLVDVRRGNKTEVEYINGYIVRRGEEMGIKPVMNYLMMQLVQGKCQIINHEVDNYSPHEHTLAGIGQG